MNVFRSNTTSRESGFIMASLLAFMAIIAILTPVVLLVSVQAQNVAIKQQLVQQAQLASVTALEFAKEQYEIDITYMGSGEQTLSTDDRYTVTYEVQHQGFSNDANTQQDVIAIGRVYLNGESEPVAQRSVRGKVTRDAGSGSSFRFVFIVDNSSSMTTAEWNESKGTVDAAIQYVIDNVPTAEVAVVQYGTNNYSHEHKYDVTVPFTNDRDDAIDFDRRYGTGTPAWQDIQDYMAASLARMRNDNVYGPGQELDLENATNVQYVVFTDAWGVDFSGCCSALAHEPTTTINTTNGGDFTTLDNLGEFNELKNGNVFAGDGYPGLTAQFTILNISTDTFSGYQSRQTRQISAAIASPGGTWNGVIAANPDDPEGDGTLPRRYIRTSLAAGPTEILEILGEIIEEELNF